MWWTSPFSWVAFAIFCFWALGAYNRLIRLRSAVVQTFGSLDAHLVRLVALVSEFGAAHAVHRASMSGDNKSDEHPHMELQHAVMHLNASLSVARSNPLQADAVATMSVARDALHVAWNGAVHPLGSMSDWVNADFDPTRQALVDGRPSVWQVRWDEHVFQNDRAAHAYNEAVHQYNVAISQFPANLSARMFGFQAAHSLSPILES
ncbi:MAG: LemA family protein [Burkholderiaceae bacterium]|nr:LemA family protein [Burkholderiaceae bacterium]